MRVLLLLTRTPGGRQSGRKAVLNTAIHALASLGHEVCVLIVGPDSSPSWQAPEGVEVRFLRRPPLAWVAWNAASRVPFGKACFNECLYYSEQVARAVRFNGMEADCVFVDTVRMFPLAEGLNLPLIVDFDDLLSKRYTDAGVATGGGRTTLGYYGSDLPRLIAWPFGAAAAAVMNIESRLVARREIAIARRAEVSSLVSHLEATELSERAGVETWTLPMAVQPWERPAAVASAPSNAFLFVGGMDYRPNLESIRWFAREVLPEVVAIQPDFRLDVVGTCPAHVARDFANSHLRFLGYVEDLDAVYRSHRAVLAPIVSGSGIKMKVLEAMAAGVPVIGSASAFQGLNVQNSHECLVANEPAAYAELVDRLSTDGLKASRIGLRAREFIREGFAPEVVRRRWAQALLRVSNDREGHRPSMLRAS